ncbi:hypothetical protein C8J56DRAFT_1069546 [Mycena floridula]|nr:hypothetical protein C8J56DRAFT_1069546 [Mycena floridula]
MILGEGQSFAEAAPGLVNHSRLRIAVATKRTNPELANLTEWEVVKRMMDAEARGPTIDRYIRCVFSEDNINLVVTMLEPLVNLVHSMHYLTIDYTFKRIDGKMNEWEIVGFSPEFTCRKSVASLYCDSQTTQAFFLLFREFFRHVERVTGKALRFRAFVADEEKEHVMMSGIVLDGEVPQFLGLAECLARSGMNNPAVSGIQNTDGTQLALHITRTCYAHFDRAIEALSKATVPRDEVERLKSIYRLPAADFAQWCKECEESVYPAVRNWYAHKKANWFILHTINPNLSRMTHSKSNEEGIQNALSLGIEVSKENAMEQAAELVVWSTHGALPNDHNNAKERERKNHRRTLNTQVRRGDLCVSQNRLVELKETITQLQAKITRSLALTKQRELEKAVATTPEGKRLLKVELDRLVKERNQWRDEKKAILDSEQFKDLVEATRGTKINGRRPETAKSLEPEPRPTESQQPDLPITSVPSTSSSSSQHSPSQNFVPTDISGERNDKVGINTSGLSLRTDEDGIEDGRIYDFEDDLDPYKSQSPLYNDDRITETDDDLDFEDSLPAHLPDIPSLELFQAGIDADVEASGVSVLEKRSWDDNEYEKEDNMEEEIGDMKDEICVAGEGEDGSAEIEAKRRPKRRRKADNWGPNKRSKPKPVTVGASKISAADRPCAPRKPRPRELEPEILEGGRKTKGTLWQINGGVETMAERKARLNL